MRWYIEVMKKYAVFRGRARRTEYWMFTLFNVVISVCLGALPFMLGPAGVVLAFIAPFYAVGVLIPSIAVSVRRLHDSSNSGWLLLLAFIPLLGLIALLVLFALPSDSGDNKYGPNPGAAAPAAPGNAAPA